MTKEVTRIFKELVEEKDYNQNVLYKSLKKKNGKKVKNTLILGLQIITYNL